MSRIAIFGAGGRAGRAVTTEALRHGHEITAVVRDPDKYRHLTDVTVARGDVTDATDVATVAAGHDAVVAATTPASSPEAFASLDFDDRYYVRAADALLAGLARAGVSRGW